jgi:hypothetical protein
MTGHPQARLVQAYRRLCCREDRCTVGAKAFERAT